VSQVIVGWYSKVTGDLATIPEFDNVTDPDNWLPVYVDAEPEKLLPRSITCPRCGRTSYNPTDIDEGYCGACHDWTRR
jgi:ribosomal protein S27AE